MKKSIMIIVSMFIESNKILFLKILTVIGWTVVLIILFSIGIYHDKIHITKSAAIEAQAILERDIIYRKWISGLGGVYAPISKTTQPNPYLKVPERDIVTPSGKKLTLICPAYIIRLLSNPLQRQYNIKERIVSFNPINPNNRPNKWEVEALKAFKNGAKSYTTILKQEGKKYLCFTKPLVIERSCLKCHDGKIGDVRGAVSVQVPVKRYAMLEFKHSLMHAGAYFIIWIIGCLGILWTGNIVKRDMKKIRSQEKQLQDVYRGLDRSQIGFFLTDKSYKILYMNQTMKRWFGDLTGKTCHKAIFNLNSPCPGCSFNNTEEIERHFPYEINTSDGKIFEILSCILTDEEGNFSRIAIVKDITEQKRAERQMARLEKLESLGILAGGIAHDFNNLLGGIFGSIELAKFKSSPDHAVYPYLEMAHKELRRAIALTKQLLAFSKGGEPILESVDIKSVIQEVTKFHLSGSRIKAHFDIQEKLWNVNVDKGQISQVISNLIINAMQAMPDGGNLYIKLENIQFNKKKSNIPLKGDFVKITIRDEGIGIPEKHLDKIFDPYFSTKQTGSGLGLSIVYGIIEKHKGYITVDSKLGAGTIFHIYLPASGEASSKPKRIEVPKQLDNNGQLKRALIMDDEESIRHILGDMLKLCGYQVDLATNGKETIEKYRLAKEKGKPFDVVIMDLTIPGEMGGKEAIKEILMIDPKAKVIVMSGYSDDPILAQYTKYGFKGRLIKPFTIEDLQRELDKIKKFEKQNKN